MISIFACGCHHDDKATRDSMQASTELMFATAHAWQVTLRYTGRYGRKDVLAGWLGTAHVIEALKLINNHH